MISDKVRAELSKIFKENLVDDVFIYLEKDSSELSENIDKFLKEVSSLSEKIIYESKELNCFIKPCISINSNKDFGIRYLGLPSGGEFKTFIDTIIMVSKNNYDLTERTLDILEMVDKDIDIKVFITKSCGWCPLTLKKMYSFALANDYITVYGIDCHDFKDIAIKYNVSTVPKVIINDKVEFVGYKEENDILGYILSAVGG